MVPQHPAAIGRRAATAEPVPAEPRPEDSDPHPRDGGGDARSRNPHHDLAPCRVILPQNGRVQPVRHRPEPVPQPLALGRRLHHAARRGGNIHLAPLRICQRHLPQGAMPVEPAGHGPLVARQPLGVGHGRLPKAASDARGIAGIDLGKRGPPVRGDRAPLALPCLDPPDRHIVAHFEQQLSWPSPGIERRRHVHRPPVDRLRARHLLGGRERGVGDVDHHEPRRKPHREQQAARNPDPAVHEIEPAPAKLGERCGAAARNRHGARRPLNEDDPGPIAVPRSC